MQALGKSICPSMIEADTIDIIDIMSHESAVELQSKGASQFGLPTMENNTM
jgi:hypothetical protein